MLESLSSGYTLDGDNFGDLGDFLLNDSFDTRFQSHLAHGAAPAGPGQPHLDNRTIYPYQLNASAVSLQHGSYLGKRLLDLLTHLFPPVRMIVRIGSFRHKITYKRRRENKILSIMRLVSPDLFILRPVRRPPANAPSRGWVGGLSRMSGRPPRYAIRTEC